MKVAVLKDKLLVVVYVKVLFALRSLCWYWRSTLFLYKQDLRGRWKINGTA